MPNKLIQDIRNFEARNGLKPADITIDEKGKITVTIDKSVLYECKPAPQSWWQSFWSWANDNDASFNPKAHAQRISSKLQLDDNVTVAVRKRKKQLPIPYFSIPTPFDNSGTLVRDMENLAVQKIKVSLTFSPSSDLTPYDSKIAIRQLIKAGTLSHAEEGSPELPSAARRDSWNLIKWLLHGLVAPFFSDSFTLKLPNILRKTARPKEWGTDFCEEQINHGFINSGLAASMVNATVLAPLTMGSGSILCQGGEVGTLQLGSGNIRYSNRNATLYNPYGYISEIETKRIPTSSRRFSFFMQTRAKLMHDDRCNTKNVDRIIDDAIDKTFGKLCQ